MVLVAVRLAGAVGGGAGMGGGVFLMAGQLTVIDCVATGNSVAGGSAGTDEYCSLGI